MDPFFTHELVGYNATDYMLLGMGVLLMMSSVIQSIWTRKKRQLTFKQSITKLSDDGHFWFMWGAVLAGLGVIGPLILRRF